MSGKSGSHGVQPQAQIVFSQTTASISGPLPPPSILQQYEALFPGSAERIIHLAEQQSEHRQHLEKTVIEGDDVRSKRAQAFGFIIAMTAIIAGVMLILIGKSTEGLVSIITAVSGLVGTFVVGTLLRRSERLKKNAQSK